LNKKNTPLNKVTFKLNKQKNETYSQKNKKSIYHSSNTQGSEGLRNLLWSICKNPTIHLNQI